MPEVLELVWPDFWITDEEFCLVIGKREREREREREKERERVFIGYLNLKACPDDGCLFLLRAVTPRTYA